jgi:hypothetical protein
VNRRRILVKYAEPKLLTGSNQKVDGWLLPYGLGHVAKAPSGNRRALNGQVREQSDRQDWERGNPDFSPLLQCTGVAAGNPQGKLLGKRA